MAFFKFRKSGDEPSATPVQPESIEVMRKRARHRLIGAAVLVLVGVIGFPLLFDKQPRPISVDIPIEIPDRNKVKPLAVPEPAAALKTEEKLPDPVASAASEAPKTVASPEPVAIEKQVQKTVEKVAEKAPPVPPKADDGAKAQALLDGQEVDKKVAASEGRFVVQVGAFADAARAREVRLKVEHAGLKTYTQMVESKEGRRIRVRAGPFTGKAEADKAAEKIKKLNLPATTLTL